MSPLSAKTRTLETIALCEPASSKVTLYFPFLPHFSVMWISIQIKNTSKKVESLTQPLVLELPPHLLSTTAMVMETETAEEVVQVIVDATIVLPRLVAAITRSGTRSKRSVETVHAVEISCLLPLIRFAAQVIFYFWEIPVRFRIQFKQKRRFKHKDQCFITFPED